MKKKQPAPPDIKMLLLEEHLRYRNARLSAMSSAEQYTPRLSRHTSYATWSHAATTAAAALVFCLLVLIVTPPVSALGVNPGRADIRSSAITTSRQMLFIQ